MREKDEGVWRVSDLLREWTKEADLGKRLKAEMVALRWAEAVGEGIASRTKVEGIEGGVLLVAAESPVWANEISLRKAQIMERLNKLAGEEVIRDIRIVPRRRREEERRPRIRRPRPDFSLLTPEMLKEVEETTRKVSDPETREALKRAMLSYYAMEAAQLKERG